MPDPWAITLRVGSSPSTIAEMTATASTAVPNSFRAALYSEGSYLAVRDASAPGQALDAEWSPDLASAFTTATETDVTPPQVTGVHPPDGAVDVGLSTNVVVSMSEPIDPATASIGTPDAAIRLFDADDPSHTDHTATVQLSADGLLIELLLD